MELEAPCNQSGSSMRTIISEILNVDFQGKRNAIWLIRDRVMDGNRIIAVAAAGPGVAAVTAGKTRFNVQLTATDPK